MNKVIAIAQHKGGVGKTTTTINLGAALQRKGYKVLLIDLDAQANLTESLAVSSEQSKGILEALKGQAKPESLPIKTQSGLDIIASKVDLASLEEELYRAIGRELKLKEAIKPLRKRYDYILIDCPPSLGLLTVNALTAADLVYIPLQAEYLAIKGLENLIGIITLIKKHLNKPLEIGGVIITQYDSRKVLNRNTGEAVNKLLKGKVLKTKIRENIALAEAPTAGQDIFNYAPSSNGAADYKALADEIVKR